MQRKYFEHFYRENLYTEWIVHWHLDEKSPVGSFRDRWVGISRNFEKHMEFLEFRANYVFTECNKT